MTREIDQAGSIPSRPWSIENEWLVNPSVSSLAAHITNATTLRELVVVTSLWRQCVESFRTFVGCARAHTHTHTHTHIAHLLMARVKLSSQCRTKARVTLYAICRVRCAAYSSCPRQIHASTRTPPIHLLLISLYCLGGLTQNTM